MITEQVKQKIIRANEMKANNPDKSMSAILKEVELSPTLYYYHKRQGSVAAKRATKIPRADIPDFPTEVKAIQKYKKQISQLKLELLNELGLQ